MNKRFSTLLATALVAVSSVSAQQAIMGEQDLKDVKSGTYIYLSPVKVDATAIPLAGVLAPAFGMEKADTTAIKPGESWMRADSMLWTVQPTVTTAGVTYKLQNKRTLAYLSMPKVSTSKEGTVGTVDAKFTADGITDWAYNGSAFYAINNVNGKDSVRTLCWSEVDKKFYVKANPGTIAPTANDANVLARFVRTEFTMNADQFNTVVKGKFYFNAANTSDKKAPVKPTEDNILSDNTWFARTAYAAPANADTLLNLTTNQAAAAVTTANEGKFTSAAAADKTIRGYKTAKTWLQVDTVYVAGTTADAVYNSESNSKAMKLPALSLVKDTLPGYIGVAGNRAEYTGKNSDQLQRPMGAAMWVVRYALANDSISIQPVSVPKLTTHETVAGKVGFMADSLSMLSGTYACNTIEFDAAKRSYILKDSAVVMPTVALRLLGNNALLVVDTLTAAQTYFPLIQPYATKAVGGDATISTDKIYFLKLAGHNFNANGTYGSKENYNGKYITAPLSMAAIKGAANTVEVTDLVLAGTASAVNVSDQWIAVKGDADGVYSIINRATGTVLAGGGINKIEKIGEKEVENVFQIGTDTIRLVEAGAIADAKEEYTGYYYEAAGKLTNKMFQLTSAYEYLLTSYMQGDDKSVFLGETESAMYLVPADGEGKGKAYGAEITGVPALKRVAYKLKDADGKYVSGLNSASTVNYVMDANAANASAFYIKEIAKDNYILIDTATWIAQNKPAALSREFYQMFKLDAKQKAPLVIPTGLISSEIAPFILKEMDTPSMEFKARGHQNIKFGNEMLTIGKDNFAVGARVGDLKAEYASEDFTFYLDTVAYVEGEKAAYYVSKAIANPTAEQEGFRMYLTLADADSVKAHATDKVNPYLDSDNNYRFLFRPAMRYGVDSLVVFNTRLNKKDVMETVKDTINIKSNAAAVNGFRFKLETILGESGVYRMVTNDGGAYVQMVGSNNDLVKAGKAGASVVTLAEAETPTSNGSINADDNTISVVAGEGNVTVYGAAGKTIIVSDVVGHNTTVIATSDAETISAPAGVVIVKVGEFVDKTVVK